MTQKKEPAEPIWIARNPTKCTGCRKCEIACSLFHEKRVWPEASRIRVFMLVPGVEFPHLCAQCEDYPCVQACPTKALSISRKTSAVLVKADKCVACGKCIDACPGRIPHMHPAKNHILICDLCKGDPKCVRVCQEGGWNVLKKVRRTNRAYKLFARTPEETTHSLATKMYGEKAEDFM
ncbi:MAG: 4Fe-4S dicluster domain-containing protein [Candidatus Bathyarchaeia archaeon]